MMIILLSIDRIIELPIQILHNPTWTNMLKKLSIKILKDTALSFQCEKQSYDAMIIILG